MRRPTVRESMDEETFAVPPDYPILDAVALLIEHGLTGVPVVDRQGRVLGVLSEEHCLKLVATGGTDADVPQGKVSWYHDTTVPCVEPGMDVYYVAGMFLRHTQHRRFPVVEDGRLVGVITRKDILKVLARQLETL